MGADCASFTAVGVDDSAAGQMYAMVLFGSVLFAVAADCSAAGWIYEIWPFGPVWLVAVASL
jgi:hypothetical protein